MKAFLRKKAPAPGNSGRETFERCLTARDLTLLGIGAIIGGGIFVLTGIAAATLAGPGVVLAFVIAGIASTFAALAYAELAAAYGGCGSAYGYCYAAFGELSAWLVGWTLLLEYGLAIAAVASSWSGYFANMAGALGLALPNRLNAATAGAIHINLPAGLIVLALTVLLIVGVKTSARFNALMVAIKAGVLCVFAVIATGHIDWNNWSPFLPFGWLSHGPDGKFVGVLPAAALVFFAYIGFDAISTAAEEAHSPATDLPFGIVISLAICTSIYLLISALLTLIAPYHTLNVGSPVTAALMHVGITWASALVAAGVLAGLTTVMLVLFYALTRILFATCRDGLLPRRLASINAVTRTPIRIILPCGLLIALLAATAPLAELAQLVNIGTLAAFVMVCTGVIILRIREPHRPRPFRAPFGLVIPALGAVSCCLLMLALPLLSWIRFILWLVAGIAIYFLYSLRHSNLAERQ